MASIYDKALKRKDFSGVVNKDAKKDAPPPKSPNKAQTKGGSKFFSIESSNADSSSYSSS